jgi:hypothetical protein
VELLQLKGGGDEPSDFASTFTPRPWAPVIRTEDSEENRDSGSRSRTSPVQKPGEATRHRPTDRIGPANFKPAELRQ